MLCDIFPTCDFPNWSTMVVEAIIGIGIALFIYKIDRKNKEKTTFLTEKINENTKQMNTAIQKINQSIEKTDKEKNQRKRLLVDQASGDIHDVERQILLMEKIHFDSKQNEISNKITDKLTNITGSLNSMSEYINVQNIEGPSNLIDQLRRLNTDVEILRKINNAEAFQKSINQTIRHIEVFKDTLTEVKSDLK